MKKFLTLVIACLPLMTLAQGKPSEIYYLYKTPDSTAWMVREYRYGGYEDSFTFINDSIRRSNMSEEQRRRYDSLTIEDAKLHTYYTREELSRCPVVIKPGDKEHAHLRGRR